MQESSLGAPITQDQVAGGVGAVALQVEPGNMQQPLAAVVTGRRDSRASRLATVMSRRICLASTWLDAGRPSYTASLSRL